MIAYFLFLHPCPHSGRPEDYGLFFAINSLLKRDSEGDEGDGVKLEEEVKAEEEEANPGALLEGTKMLSFFPLKDMVCSAQQQQHNR